MEAEGMLIVALVVGLYLLPAIIAANKNHKNVSAICVLNVLTGWTGLGWLAALIWSLTDGSKPQSKAEEIAELLKQVQALQGVDKK